MALVLFASISNAQDGPYAPAANEIGSTAIHADSNIFVQWANAAVLTRGWMDIADTTLGYVDVGDSSSCIGAAGTNGVVSLGDAGEVILHFDGYIVDGPGADFAVFENSFSDFYLELATVEVSSDGEYYVPFNSISLTQSDSQVGTFGLLDPSYIHNLAGKYRGLYGTPFDLNELSGIEDLNINAITHVRIIDVVGVISGSNVSYDSEDHVINDPYPTAFGSGGFDLDALGIINWSSQTTVEENQSRSLQSFPNPFSDRLHFITENEVIHIEIYNSSGRKVWEEERELEGELIISTTDWQKGIYIIHLNKTHSYPVIKI